jgi:beta-xylosidase
MRRAVIAHLIALAALQGALPPGAAGGGYENPVFAREFPDPSVLRVGRDYYAYGTAVRWSGRTRLMPILRSRDLVDWRPAGAVFRRPPRWSGGHWWGPAALRHGGRTYLFYSATRARDGRHCVAVAVGRGPTGPFRTRRVLTCARGPAGAIDPAPFRDSDGSAYLLFARTHATCGALPGRCGIAIVRLRHDLLATRGRSRPLLAVSQPWEIAPPVYAAVENPWLLRTAGGYTLLYSGGDWKRRYAMGYATSLSPWGPFKKGAAPILIGRPGMSGPGGGSVVRGPRGDRWLVYHGRRAGKRGVAARKRTLMIDRLVLSGVVPRVEGPTLSSTLVP